jgi:hypothetical protein
MRTTSLSPTLDISLRPHGYRFPYRPPLGLDLEVSAPVRRPTGGPSSRSPA